MEIKNQTSYTYETLMEFNRQHQRGVRLAVTILLCISTGINLCQIILNLILLASGHEDTFDPDPIRVLSMNVIFGILFLLIPLILRRRNCRKQDAAHMVTECIFTEEKYTETFTSDTTQQTSERKYDIITKVTESEHAFYLYIAPNAAHIVAKDGFTEGTEQDFRILLRTVVDGKKLHIK